MTSEPNASSVRCESKSRRFEGESGSVTAELVAVLPIFVMLIGLIAVVGSGQIQRVGLVVAASQGARALAIGETLPPIGGGKVIQRANGAKGEVCASASSQLRVLNFGALKLIEESCVRELGH